MWWWWGRGVRAEEREDITKVKQFSAHSKFALVFKTISNWVDLANIKNGGAILCAESSYILKVAVMDTLEV